MARRIPTRGILVVILNVVQVDAVRGRGIAQSPNNLAGRVDKHVHRDVQRYFVGKLIDRCAA